MRDEQKGKEAVMGADTYGYAYDPIGNCVWSAVNTLTNGYTANRLNQYSLISNHVNHVNPVRIHPTYDADGNMRWDGRLWHTWDAENRLVRSEPGLGGATNGSVRVVNDYDHMHRRIQKRVEVLTGRGAGYPMDPSQAGTWDVVETRMFIYDGWNLAAEVVVDAQTGTTNVTRYLWGPDLSGTLQGAGGVGGLLAVTTADLAQPNSLTTYYPSYDANGNITEYVDGSGNIRAHYEYSPFGEIIAQSGDLADTFHFRFSTKPWCPITGLSEYELRKYRPDLGRWLNRDPIEERSELLLYGFIRNNAVSYYDYLGAKCISDEDVGSVSYTPWGIEKGIGVYGQIVNTEIFGYSGVSRVTIQYSVNCVRTKLVCKKDCLPVINVAVYYYEESHEKRKMVVDNETIFKVPVPNAPTGLKDFLDLVVDIVANEKRRSEGSRLCAGLNH